jgi:hypothetical protein
VAFFHWLEVVNLQLHGGDSTLAVEVALKGNPHCRICHGRGDTPVGHSYAVSQVVAKAALDS